VSIIRPTTFDDVPAAGTIHDALAQASDVQPLIKAIVGLFETSPVLIGAFDPDDRLQYANPAFRSAFYIGQAETPAWEQMMRSNFEKKRGLVLETDDFDAWLANISSRRGKKQVRSFQSDFVDGRWLWVVETTHETGWIMTIATDVTSLRVSERRLCHDRDVALRVAETDELTKISNRRHIMGLLGQTIAVTVEAGSPRGCVCLMDLDHFKRVNDLMGHICGDEVLVNFAQLVRGIVRLRDGFGRIGGEEFLMVMPNTNQHEAEAIVRRVLDETRGAALAAAAPELGITASAGLTVIKGYDSVESVYQRCDKALYLAKNSGRDQLRVCLS